MVGPSLLSFLIQNLERMVHTDRAMKQHPGRLVGYRETIRNIYQHVHFPLDPRQFFRLWHASSMKVYGSYLGPDKIGHLADMGYLYYKAYHGALEAGLSEEEALQKANVVGTDGAIFGEKGMLGYLSAGAYSNADLASNYVGLKFYLNLTEPTRLKGEMHPPMIERSGPYWQLAPHVRRDSRFFAAFISDHFNEALNPSLFERGMRKAVRKAVRIRTEKILRWYADDNGNRRPKAYFDDRVEELSTYWGEDYGHMGTYDEMITIGNTCFDDPPTGDDVGDDADAQDETANGYQALHWAALAADTEQASSLIDEGADIDEPVGSLESYSAEWGNTPLHVAAAAGHLEMVRLLLVKGASVNRANEKGATPLHRAIDHPAVVALLLEHGAEVDAADEQGRTPIHWLARYPTLESVSLLVDAGANLNAQDHRGETPLHRAAYSGQIEMIDVLLSGGASLKTPADFDTTPLHFAVRQNDPAVVELLIARHADPNARDDFGWTPLHDVAQRGRFELAEVLIAGGADPDAADHGGSTPLHVAARAGQESVLSVLLETGANVNAINDSGGVPLHGAALVGRPSLVNLLLAHGADASVENIRGQSARDLASARGNSLAVFLMSPSYPATNEAPVDIQ